MANASLAPVLLVSMPQMLTAIARIDTPEELVAFSHGGILPYVLRQLVKKSH